LHGLLRFEFLAGSPAMTAWRRGMTARATTARAPGLAAVALEQIIEVELGRPVFNLDFAMIIPHDFNHATHIAFMQTAEGEGRFEMELGCRFVHVFFREFHEHSCVSNHGVCFLLGLVRTMFDHREI
jgi:hypothetical protein